ncbi:MAG: TauD/TfdA family dioxygenase [Pseudomonadota bacterium]
MSSLPFTHPANSVVLGDKQFPLMLDNPQGFTTMDPTLDFLATHRDTLLDAAATSGAILFRNYPLVDAASFDRFAAALSTRPFTYQESLSNAVRINLTDRVFTANEAPPGVEIFLHHEMAQTPDSPRWLFFYCHTSATAGGATPLVRSDWLFDRLQSEAPDWATELATRGVRYRTRMPGENDAASGQGRSWKSTLGAANRAEAEQRLEALGYSFEWHADDSVSTRTPVLPAVRDLPDGRRSLFNQLIAAYCGWRGAAENPTSAITWGDDGEIPRALLEYLAHTAYDLAFDLEWQDGDLALVDNALVMHGRRPFSGDRKRAVWVAMGR